MRALARHAPTWLVQMPSLVGAAELRALQRRAQAATRERMLRELTEAVEALALETPVVLWLEDLHWSDVSTLDWLAFLGRRPEPARLMVLSTYRPADVLANRASAGRGEGGAAASPLVPRAGPAAVSPRPPWRSTCSADFP